MLVARSLAGEGLFVRVGRTGDDGPASFDVAIPGRLLTRRDLLSPLSLRGDVVGDFETAFLGDLAVFDAGALCLL